MSFDCLHIGLRFVREQSCFRGLSRSWALNCHLKRTIFPANCQEGVMKPSSLAVTTWQWTQGRRKGQVWGWFPAAPPCRWPRTWSHSGLCQALHHFRDKKATEKRARIFKCFRLLLKRLQLKVQLKLIYQRGCWGFFNTTFKTGQCQY